MWPRISLLTQQATGERIGNAEIRRLCFSGLFRTARTKHILVSYKDEGLIRLEPFKTFSAFEVLLYYSRRTTRSIVGQVAWIHSSVGVLTHPLFSLHLNDF